MIVDDTEEAVIIGRILRIVFGLTGPAADAEAVTQPGNGLAINQRACSGSLGGCTVPVVTFKKMLVMNEDQNVRPP